MNFLNKQFLQLFKNVFYLTSLKFSEIQIHQKCFILMKNSKINKFNNVFYKNFSVNTYSTFIKTQN